MKTKIASSKTVSVFTLTSTMTNWKIISMGILLFTFALASCTKEAPQDEIGPVGLQVSEVETNEDVNVGIFISDWIETAFSDEPRSSVFKVYFDKRISADLIDNGEILVYAKARNEPVILPIPFTTRECHFSSTVKIGSITFRGQSTSTTDQNFGFIEAFQYILIPPSGKPTLP